MYRCARDRWQQLGAADGSCTHSFDRAGHAQRGLPAERLSPRDHPHHRREHCSVTGMVDVEEPGVGCVLHDDELNAVVDYHDAFLELRGGDTDRVVLSAIVGVPGVGLRRGGGIHADTIPLGEYLSAYMDESDDTTSEGYFIRHATFTRSVSVHGYAGSDEHCWNWWEAHGRDTDGIEGGADLECEVELTWLRAHSI